MIDNMYSTPFPQLRILMFELDIGPHDLNIDREQLLASSKHCSKLSDYQAIEAVNILQRLAV